MINNWDEIWDKNYEWGNLLLGNGFSCNAWSSYSYRSLLDYSKQKSIKPLLGENIFKIFEDLNTCNFEDVLKALTLTAIVKEAINEETIEVIKLYEIVRNNLFNTVHATHIPFSQLKKEIIGIELSRFRKVFTTCYDLIPYWSAFSEIDVKKQVDFFWNSNGFNSRDTAIYNHNQVTAFYYLHGALHLQTSLTGEISKISGTAKDLPFGYEYRNLDTLFPLFITEGTSEYKLRKIQSNSYLNFCLNQFSDLRGGLVVLGQGLDPAFDQHLIDAITKNKNLSRVAVSIYSGLCDEAKQKLVKGYQERLYRLNNRLDIYFFESETHPLCSSAVRST